MKRTPLKRSTKPIRRRSSTQERLRFLAAHPKLWEGFPRPARDGEHSHGHRIAVAMREAGLFAPRSEPFVEISYSKISDLIDRLRTLRRVAKQAPKADRFRAWLRATVRERDGDCQRCHQEGTDVAHIHGLGMGASKKTPWRSWKNWPANCVLLCRHCHMLRDQGMERWPWGEAGFDPDEAKACAMGERDAGQKDWE